MISNLFPRRWHKINLTHCPLDLYSLSFAKLWSQDIHLGTSTSEPQSQNVCAQEGKFLLIFKEKGFHFFLWWCWWGAHMPWDMCGEAGGQLERNLFSPSTRQVPGSHSDLQAWWQAPLPATPSCWPGKHLLKLCP